MTKDEFLIRLRTLIAAMPKEERDDVMQYYSDYFEDAGPGKEQEVIRQLEGPEAVASQVMGGTLPGGQEAQDRDQGGPAYGAPAQGQQRHRNGLRSWWGVLLAICAAPIALPLAIAGAAVLVILALAALLVIGSLILSAGAIAVMGGISIVLCFRCIGPAGRGHGAVLHGQRPGLPGFGAAGGDLAGQTGRALFPRHGQLGHADRKKEEGAAMKSKTRRLLAILAGLGVLGLGMALAGWSAGAQKQNWCSARQMEGCCITALGGSARPMVTAAMTMACWTVWAVC